MLAAPFQLASTRTASDGVGDGVGKSDGVGVGDGLGRGVGGISSKRSLIEGEAFTATVAFSTMICFALVNWFWYYDQVCTMVAFGCASFA